MINSITVLVLVVVFVALGFSLGWTWCDKRTTDEYIDHITKYNLISGKCAITEVIDEE